VTALLAAGADPAPAYGRKPLQTAEQALASIAGHGTYKHAEHACYRRIIVLLHAATAERR
jgi:hypothetical protein